MRDIIITTRKNGKSKLLLFFIVIIVNIGFSQQNYIPYYQLKNKAEVAICQDKYEDALDYYKQAFRLVDFPLRKELNNSLICALLVGDTAYIYDTLTLFSGRIGLGRILNKPYMLPYLETKSWQQFAQQAEINKSIEDESINKEYIRILDSLDKEDQKPRKWIIVKPIRKRKIAFVDSLNYIAIKQLIAKWDYPNERNTGYKYIQISPMCIWHNIDTTFVDYEYQMMTQGKMTPELYVRRCCYTTHVYEHINLNISDKYHYCTNKNYSSEKLASVNQNRSAIGYPTTEEAALIWQKSREKNSLGFVFGIFLLIHSL